MRKTGFLISGLLLSGLLGYFIYLLYGGIPPSTDAFENEAGELCTPIQTVTFENGTNLLVYGCKTYPNIGEALFSIFLIVILISVAFIFGFECGKVPTIKEEEEK